MPGKNNGGVVGGGPESADTESFSFELFELGYAWTGKHDLIVRRFNRGDQDEVEAGQVGLYDGANIYNRWVSASQRLSCELSSAQENGLDFQAILFEQPFLSRHPNVALPETKGRVADSNLF